MNEGPAALLYVGLALGAFGALFFGIGLVVLRRERAFAQTALAAPGTVVGFEQRRSTVRRRGRRRTVYHDHPVVEFTTQAQQPARFVSSVGTSPRLHQEGQRITVLYDEANPGEARIADKRMQMFLPILFMFVGGILLLIGGILGFVGRFS